MNSLHAAYFVDNFSNGVATDSDGYPNFWAVHNQSAQGSVSENNDDDDSLRINIGTGGANQKVSMYSQLESNFNFFTDDGVFFKYRKIDFGGTAASANKKIWLDIVSEVGDWKNLNNSNDGIRVQILGNGEVKLQFKVNNSATTDVYTYTESGNATPDFVRLKLSEFSATHVEYELKLYYSSLGEIETATGTYPLTKGNWGNEGNASLHMTAWRTGNDSGSFQFAMTDIYAHDDSNEFTGDLYDQITLAPPGVNVNDGFFENGLLNVKKAPYNAVGNGIANDTAALQRAIIDAYEYDLACYIPHGTYKTTKQLRVMNKVTLIENPSSDGPTMRVTGSKRKKTCIIIGEKMDSNGNRPLIKATIPAGDAAVHFWSQRFKNDENGTVGTDDPDDAQGNIGFNMIIKGINLDVTNQTGAYGLAGLAAQGCSIQDMKIIATGAKAGIYKMLGVGGGYFNIEIVGGEYGLYVPNGGSDTSEYPQVYGLKLYDQTVKSIEYKGLGQLVIAGLDLRKANGPAIELNNLSSLGPGSISIIDGIIEFTNANQSEAINNELDNDRARCLYLRNVFIKNANNVTRSIAADSDGWTQVHEYSYSGYNDGSGTESNGMVDSLSFAKNKDVSIDVDSTITASDVPNDIVSRHIWDEQGFPSFEDADAVNVKDLANNAVGDGVTDDFDALQAAIDANDKVFLPKGIYLLSEPLTLHQNTKIFGLGITLSMLRPVDDGTWAVGEPVIKTDNDVNGDFTTTFAFLCINFNKTSKNAAIEWRAGEMSMVRAFHVGQSENIWGNPMNPNMQSVVVKQGGGGRWWASAPCEAQTALLSGHSNYRLFLIDGTSAPLSFYGMNVERQASEPMSEVKNAANVFIYSFKGENSTGKSHDQTLLQFTNSDNVMLFGYSGIAKSINPNDQLFKFVDSYDVLAANLLPQKTSVNTPGDMVAYHLGSSEDCIAFPKGCALFRSGDPELLVHALPSSNPETTIFEVENCVVIGSSGDAEDGMYSANASGTGNPNYMHFKANAVNDYIQYQVNIPAGGGTFEFRVGIQHGLNCGKVQLKVNANTVIGPDAGLDSYDGTWMFNELVYGSNTFTSGGNRTLTFTVKSKNANSTGYKFRPDYIKIIKQ